MIDAPGMSSFVRRVAEAKETVTTNVIRLVGVDAVEVGYIAARFEVVSRFGDWMSFLVIWDYSLGDEDQRWTFEASVGSMRCNFTAPGKLVVLKRGLDALGAKNTVPCIIFVRETMEALKVAAHGGHVDADGRRVTV